jgi:GST-like protein
MLKFYFHTGPNPMKVALFLEESGLDYEVVGVDTRKGEQHDPAFLAINPNGKTPALTDDGIPVFDSNAILLYLGEKTGQFMPDNSPASRAALLSWLMFCATGIGPYSGQSVHFRHFAPAPKDYAVNRYGFEVERHYKILDAQLAKGPYMLGNTYTIVDMAVWGWARMLPFVLGEPNAFDAFPNVKRLHDEISARPAAARANAIKDRFTFKTDMDDDAKKHLFPSNARLAAAE